MGCHWAGIVYGRVFEQNNEDATMWNQLWVEDGEHHALMEHFRTPHEFRRTYDGEDKWMGIPIAITDEAVRGGENANIGFSACRIDKLQEIYADRLAHASRLWKKLRKEFKDKHGIDIGKATLILASDYR